MTDDLVQDIERARDAGAVIVLKWDGERASEFGTVIVSHQASSFTFRRETNDVLTSLREALAKFWASKQAAG